MTSLAVVAGLIALYGLVAARLDRASIGAPLVLVVGGAVLGSGGLDWISLQPGSEPVQVLAELTLAILLFSDASLVSLSQLRDDAMLPARLLGIGLPLTMILGAALAFAMIPGAYLGVAALLGAILAPTDAALGLPVVNSPSVPSRIRRLVNVESGLNDGIATPFVMLFLALVVAEEAHAVDGWLLGSAGELARALAVAAVGGGLGGRALAAANARGLSSTMSTEIAIVMLAVLSYAASVAVGGNGFVAAFACGIVFNTVSGGALSERGEFGEKLGLVGSMLVWTLFGATLVGPQVAAGIPPLVVVYAVLSLTVVRMLPVAIALAGARLRRETVAFVGWFGPRGLATVVFTLIAAETLGTTPEAHIVVQVATCTVFLSIVVHGVSAGPLAAWYGRVIRAGDLSAPELVTVTATRVPHRARPHVAEPSTRVRDA